MSKRSPLIHALPCVCCAIEGVDQPNRTEEHHLNSGGLMGKKRRGDAYSIPLCGWHHRGELPMDMLITDGQDTYGPSFALTAKKFRERYHGDDFLLSITNNCIESGSYQLQATA